MQRPGLFRQQALKHIASPDDLDQVIAITNPQGWAALAGLVMLVAVALGWGFFASVPITISANGAFQPVGGIADIVAPAEGQIVGLMIEAGTSVTAGQTIGTVNTGGVQAPILAPIAGTIDEIVTPLWAPAKRNDVVARLRPAGSPLEAIVYLPSSLAPTVKTGMVVQILPATQTADSNGFITGTVLRIAQAPASRQSVLRVMSTDDAVDAIFANNALPVRVDVRLDVSGGQLVWSAGTGNDALVRTGVNLTARIVLGEGAPLSIFSAPQSGTGLANQ